MRSCPSVGGSQAREKVRARSSASPGSSQRGRHRQQTRVQGVGMRSHFPVPGGALDDGVGEGCGEGCPSHPMQFA